jgi:hypothetical protein
MQPFIFLQSKLLILLQDRSLQTWGSLFSNSQQANFQPGWCTLNMQQFLTNHRFQVSMGFSLYPVLPTVVFGFIFVAFNLYMHREGQSSAECHQSDLYTCLESMIVHGKYDGTSFS